MTANDTHIQILRAARKANIPTLIWGDPGIGKSAMIEAFAVLEGLPAEVVIGSLREPSDFAGLPIVTPQGVHMEPPTWAKRLVEAGDGILFLDELTTAPPAVQAAMLRVVLDRWVGDVQLPEGIGIIAAANPPESAANGWELPAPLANRFLHLEASADPATFIEGMTLGWSAVMPNATASELTTPSSAAFAKARAEVAAFVQVNPVLLHKMPTTEAEAGKAWPSPRTWEFVATMLPRLTPEAALVAVNGLVGEGAAIEFLTWREHADLPDPSEVLKDPSIVDWKDRADRIHAILTGVCAVAAHDGTKGTWDKAWKVLGACAKDGAADVAGESARQLTRCRPKDAPWPAVVKVFAPVLKQAGLSDVMAA